MKCMIVLFLAFSIGGNPAFTPSLLNKGFSSWSEINTSNMWGL